MASSVRRPRFVASSIAALVVLASAAFVACSAEPTTSFGPPSGLRGQDPTTAFSDNAAVDSGGGITPTGDSGGTGSALCNGAGPIDGGACAVKWKTDLYPKFTAGGAWKCSDANCHGGPSTPPVISGTDSHAAYMALVSYKLVGGTKVPYFNPCSVDPAQSGFVCNTAQPSTCGALPMPSTANPPGAVVPTAAELGQIGTWVACGAPEN